MKNLNFKFASEKQNKVAGKKNNKQVTNKTESQNMIHLMHEQSFQIKLFIYFRTTLF